MTGHACLAGTCGCSGAGDCPGGTSCDPVAHKCTASCGANQPCNGGCCDGANCQTGTTAAQCGSNGGLCASCANSALGHLCNAAMGGGACGCVSANDCPNGSTCAAGLCSKGCSMNAPCNSGCCSNAQNGSCQPGSSATLCGGTGTLCVDCSASPSGHTCLANKLACGCTRTADCPTGKACDLGTSTCTAACNANQLCNGGCCAGGTCGGGTAAAACGAGGSTCADCTGSANGHLCLGGACGCNAASDCAASLACDSVTHLCTKACTGNQLCNGGCCAGGQCQPGTTIGFCGSSGGACFTCGNDKPSCVAGACTSACGALGNGPCNGGFCCSNGQCVNGLDSTHCGFSGTCFSCAGNFQGGRCRINGPGEYRCGCESQTDCPAAVPQQGIAGQACDLSVHTCNDYCGDLGITPCNGGCCTGPNGSCTPGNTNASCGNNGGTCATCNLKVCTNGACL